MSVLARRYAHAAIQASEEKGGADAVQTMAKELKAFCEAYNASSELQELLLNPAFKDDRDEVLGKLAQSLKLSDTTTGLLRLLTVNDRIEIISDLAAEVEILADERSGRRRAFVTSAVALSGDQEKRIAAALEKRVGLPVLVTTEVDSNIMGGLVCKIGDLTIDNSIKRQLEIFRERLLSSH